MKITSYAFVLYFALFINSTPVIALGPIAIVEEINAPYSGLRFMDYLELGKVIELGDTGAITIGYLSSCVREQVVGGRVTIGDKKSNVSGGKVIRETIECEPNNAQLTQTQAGKSAVVVFRLPPGKKATATKIKPEVTVYGLSPLVSVSGQLTTITITRLDRPDEDLTIEVQNGYVDTEQQGITFEPGAVYQVSNGTRNIIFQIDPLATEKPGSLISRLIRL